MITSSTEKLRNTIVNLFVGAVFAAAFTVNADAKANSKSIVVVSPAELPELAQRNSEAMYLHQTGNGRTLLYLEQDGGRRLAILDVSDPAAIHLLTQASVSAPSPYDFVRSLSDSAVLVRYRYHYGFAVINLRKAKHPVLTFTPSLENASESEGFGPSGLLMTPTKGPDSSDPRYVVFDVSRPSHPELLGTVAGVRQRVEKADTGTLFLLSNGGLTVIRRLDVEEDYKTALNQMHGN
jgi:hypothetical protein